MKLSEMETKRKEVTVYLEALICKCGGEMVHTGNVLPQNGKTPETYHHKCPVCTAESVAITRYPRIQYEPKKLVVV